MKELGNCNVKVLGPLYSKRNWLLSSELFHSSIKLVFRNFILDQITQSGLDNLPYFDFCLIRRTCDMLALRCAD